MSENIPQPSTSYSPPPDHKDIKKKPDKSKLPSLHIDTTEENQDETKKEEKKAECPKVETICEQLEKVYVSTHPRFISRSRSVSVPALITEEAFQQYEKLYKLMEQLLYLREQNAKLRRRIRDLEHLNNAEQIYKHFNVSNVTPIQPDSPSLERDTPLADGYLEEGLTKECDKDSKPKSKQSVPTRIRQSILRRQRQRSGSGTEKSLDTDQMGSRRTSSVIEDAKKPAKVSKWTKVKAAFKWEKASVGDAKSQDSGLGGMMPMNLEVARYLRVPSTSEDTGHSPADSGAAGISTPGTISTASSNEDFHRNELRNRCEDFRSSEDEYVYNYSLHSKDEQNAAHKSSLKGHRTPWAKMKDIIHTKSSVKKKNRSSTHSDDIHIDIELCSDNEDVFEDEPKAIQVPVPSWQIIPKIEKPENSTDIPAEIVARYQLAIVDDTLNIMDTEKPSKWRRVKRAFLTSDEGKESRSDDETRTAQAEIKKNYKQLQKKLSLEFQEKLNEWERLKQHSPGTSNPSSLCGFSDEARDPSFIRKMEEWQRIKGRGRSSMPATNDEHLAPNFKRKLEEWNRIKKSSYKYTNAPKKRLGEVPRWKSLSGPRTENRCVFEYPVLTDEFKKKLEEWKQIKASGGPPTLHIDNNEQKKFKESKTPSPKLSRKNSSTKKKMLKEAQEKELQWFEKELGKIEREKQILERERQKFIEREERLSKLRKSVSSEKKEILIHTPSGFHRFEGISKKFTQKLYEWEKAQGIAPEASTFALLNSSCLHESRSPSKHSSAGNTPPLIRSKSADSVAKSAGSLCPLSNQQPSSLSLNDVDDLEKKRLVKSKSSSLHSLECSRESIDQDEPEALIIEVEDIIEETASPLHTYLDKKQQPIYQREEVKAICEGETLVAPKVRRSESTKAQINYNIIEEILSLLSELAENENKIERKLSLLEENVHEKYNKESKLKNLYETQSTLAMQLRKNISKLQEANDNITAGISKGSSASNVEDSLAQMQDLCSEICHLVSRVSIFMRDRCTEDHSSKKAQVFHSSHGTLVNIREKLYELRRNLSYFCAASDLRGPERRGSPLCKKMAIKTSSNESKDSRQTETDLSRGSSDKSGSTSSTRLYTKSGTSNTQSQGAIKKRIKYRQKNLQSRVSPDTDDEELLTSDHKKSKHKPTRTRSISEGTNTDVGKECQHENDNKPMQISEFLAKEIAIPTQTTILNKDYSEKKIVETPLTVFVKTTRKLFTPLVESHIRQSSPEKTDSKKSEINETKESSSCQLAVDGESVGMNENEIKNKVDKPPTKEEPQTIIHLPPLPASPSPQRRLNKEISPSIRLMMVRYDQKVNDRDSQSCKSGASSGSSTPIAMHSPASEKRLKSSTSQRVSPLLGAQREVQKSASVGFLHTGNRQVTVPGRVNINNTIAELKPTSILKSSSAGMIINKTTLSSSATGDTSTKIKDKKPPDLKVIITTDLLPTAQSLQLRKKKLQKAKAEFLQSSPPVSAPPQLESDAEALKFPARNRLSQISVGSDSSYDEACTGILIKSASAGMINIDPEVYRQIDPEFHEEGYVSLPRHSKQPKLGVLGEKFANIASKFRKVRMRRGKEKESSRKNAVSALCRQSLLVDIAKAESENESTSGSRKPSSEEASSPSTSRSSSWIKKPKLFKK